MGLPTRTVGGVFVAVGAGTVSGIPVPGWRRYLPDTVYKLRKTHAILEGLIPKAMQYFEAVQFLHQSPKLYGSAHIVATAPAEEELDFLSAETHDDLPSDTSSSVIHVACGPLVLSSTASGISRLQPDSHNSTETYQQPRMGSEARVPPNL